MCLERQKREERRRHPLEKGREGEKERERERERERESTPRLPVLRAFIWKPQGWISIESSSAFGYAPSSSWSPLSSQIGWHQGRGSLVNASGPDVSRGITPSDFGVSLGLELKHSSGLNVISRG